MKTSVEIDDDLGSRIQRLADMSQLPIDKWIRDAIERHAERLEERERQEVIEFGDLRAAWKEGNDSGEPETLDFEALKAEGRKRLASSKA